MRNSACSGHVGPRQVRSSMDWAVTRFVLAFSLCMLFIACSSSQNPTLAPNLNAKDPALLNESGHEVYHISPEDVIDVKVFQVDKLSRKLRVDARGDVRFPLLGVLQVEGLTDRQLEALLVQRLGERYLKNPQVTVSIERYVSQRVTVDGLVKKPGIFPLQGNLTLMQAIALAEGPDTGFSLADTQEVHLYRSVGDGKKDLYVLNFDQVRRGFVKDPLVRADDVIVVPPRPWVAKLKSITDPIRQVVYVSLGGSFPLF